MHVNIWMWQTQNEVLVFWIIPKTSQLMELAKRFTITGYEFCAQKQVF